MTALLNPASVDEWAAASHAALLAEFVRLTGALSEPAQTGPDVSPAPSHTGPPASALEAVTRSFGLSAFERDLLVLSAGADLDPGVAAALAAHGGRVTWALAGSLLPGAHWSAIAPGGPLRRWRLLEVGGGAVSSAPLRVSEPVLHVLLGVGDLDPALADLVVPLRPADLMAGPHRDLVEVISRGWVDPLRSWRPVALSGEDADAQLDIAWAASTRLGLQPYLLRADDLPPTPADRAELATRWTRDSLLHGAALVIDLAEERTPPGLASFLDRVDGPVVLCSRHGLALPGLSGHIVERPDPLEQTTLWREALAGRPEPWLAAAADIAAGYRLSARAIAATAAGLSDGDGPDALTTAVRDAVRRADIDGLAQPVSPTARWDDLVLPPDREHLLRSLAAQVRHRGRVHHHWGFAAAGVRGLGIAALFTGESGTGKTMAAEVLAADLGLDLLRIDLSAVVSKYIGETEKNLQRVFDSADESGAILLFDESDALFGKRSEVRDSHDRYANLEVSYLLQRMEAYRGLAILTTNARASLDGAFLRRLRVVVQFPFPDAALRREIWRRVFPVQAPTAGLDAAKLARLPASGGMIRNIALLAAFGAAEADRPITMADLAAAARIEFAKAERTLAEADLAGWTR